MQIVRIMAGLSGAADAGAVGTAVGALGRSAFGLRQCGVTWQTQASTDDGSEAWWVTSPALFDQLFVTMRDHHAPVAPADDAAAQDGIYKLLLPVIEPAGLLGAICCGHTEPYTAELERGLTTLAAHVSVRLTQLCAIGAPGTGHDALKRLTPRQTDVALLAARGRTNAAIATALGLSGNTVKKHLKDIFESLGVGNRTELSVRLNGAARPEPVATHGSQITPVLRLASGE